MTEKSRVCTNCTEPIQDNMQYCPTCGTALSAPSTSLQESPPQTQQRRDILGGVSAGVVLILFAVTYLRHPINPDTIIIYLQQLVNQRVFLKPPSILLNFIIFFCYASGAWSLILTSLRIVFQRNIRQRLTDLFTAFFSLYCGYLLTNYLEDIITGQSTVAYIIVGIGLLITGNAVIYLVRRES